MTQGTVLASKDRVVTPASCARAVLDVVPMVSGTLRREMRRHAEIGSVPKFRTLAFLGRHPGASLREVAEHQGVTDATASVLVQRLVQDDLVRREERAGERRSVTLRLTKRGSDVVQRARAATRARVAAQLAPLSARELGAITECMHVLAEVFAVEAER